MKVMKELTQVFNKGKGLHDSEVGLTEGRISAARGARPWRKSGMHVPRENT